ncbi:DUF4145 domain-containing protein [Fusobacterium varium]
MYIKPEIEKRICTCSFCKGNNEHMWTSFYIKPNSYVQAGFSSKLENFWVSACKVCGGITIWKDKDKKQIYPYTSGIEEANVDMPEEIKSLYEEARAVYPISKKSSAALLRLALQKLCKELGEEGKNINDDIKSLVAKGLPDEIQIALDGIRIVGNQAVHPGELNIDEDEELVETLFWLLNLIIEKTISSEKKTEKFYESLPEKLRNAIKIRDGK